jgi:pyridoxamine 5'-phosphate oxidase
LVSKQGNELTDPESLHHLFRLAEIRYTDQAIPMPEDWGGYAIKPLRIEFMEFRSTRFHDRKLYEQANGTWTWKQIQP